MNKKAAIENRWTLEGLLGLNRESAEKITGAAILINADGGFEQLVHFIKDILSKTFETVHSEFSDQTDYSCEVIIGEQQPKTKSPAVYFGCPSENVLTVSLRTPEFTLPQNLPPFLYFLLACYCGGQVLKCVSKTKLPINSDDEIRININKLVGTASFFSTTVDIGECYLAGAGGIGNSFLYSLSFFNVSGKIYITDGDLVSDGNLNRCLLFNEEDIDKNKAERLSLHAQPLFRNLRLVAIPDWLNKAPAAIGGGNWLKKLIVTVDSRRARRSLQEEIPGEVFDASTTGIREIVLHHHCRPLNGKACLACIYYKEEQEQLRECHIAEALGVGLEQVNQQYVDGEAAATIQKKYPELSQTELIGIPYDTLFKQLCGEGKLKTAEDKQVLAPLAFVSAFAGAMLALSFIQHHSISLPHYNYWKLSPWTNPNYRLQRDLSTNPLCDFCNDKLKSSLAEKLWTKNSDDTQLSSGP